MTSAPAITVILLTTGPDRVVARAEESVWAQDHVTLQVVVLHRPGSPLTRVQHPEPRSPDHEVLFAPSDGSLGRSLNRAVDVGTAPYFTVVDGSETLARDYFAAAVATLDANQTGGYAAAPGAFHPEENGGGLAALLASPWAVAAPVFRRASWERSGKFDEELQELVEWDLLITLEERAEPGVLLESQRPIRYRGDDVRLRAALRPAGYLESIRRVFARHQASFEDRASDALVNQERIAKRLWLRERALVARRDAARAALARDAKELARVRAALGHTAGRHSNGRTCAGPRP